MTPNNQNQINGEPAFRFSKEIPLPYAHYQELLSMFQPRVIHKNRQPMMERGLFVMTSLMVATRGPELLRTAPRTGIWWPYLLQRLCPNVSFWLRTLPNILSFTMVPCHGPLIDVSKIT